jgi:hypothetical protein
MIENLEKLPESLIVLYCCFNPIKKYDNLPYKLEYLFYDITSEFDYFYFKSVYPKLKINTIIK